MTDGLLTVINCIPKHTRKCKRLREPCNSQIFPELSRDWLTFGIASAAGLDKYKQDLVAKLFAAELSSRREQVCRRGKEEVIVT